MMKMTPQRAAVWAAGSTLLAAWLAAAAAPSFAPQSSSEPAARSPEPDPQVRVLTVETERLRKRSSAEAPREPIERNPFEFGTRTANRSAPPTIEPLVGAMSTKAPRLAPPLQLIGMAEDAPDAVDPGRTAIVSVAGTLVLAKTGDTIAGRYRVVRIGAEVVELIEEIGEIGEGAEAHGAAEPRTLRLMLP
jgi:hypothetical protein